MREGGREGGRERERERERKREGNFHVHVCAYMYTNTKSNYMYITITSQDLTLHHHYITNLSVHGFIDGRRGDTEEGYSCASVEFDLRLLREVVSQNIAQLLRGGEQFE